MENGEMTKGTVPELFYILMEKSMQDNGKIIKRMVKE
jgi:hypothetical protein